MARSATHVVGRDRPTQSGSSSLSKAVIWPRTVTAGFGVMMRDTLFKVVVFACECRPRALDYHFSHAPQR
jgi:hypothetical protein